MTAFRHRIQTYALPDDGGLDQVQLSYSHALRNVDRGKEILFSDLSRQCQTQKANLWKLMCFEMHHVLIAARILKSRTDN